MNLLRFILAAALACAGALPAFAAIGGLPYHTSPSQTFGLEDRITVTTGGWVLDWRANNFRYQPPSTPIVNTAATFVGGTPGTITITTATAHRIIVGQQFALAGVTPSVLNGTYTAAGGTSGTTLVGTPVIDLPNSPGTVHVFGTVTAEPIIWPDFTTMYTAMSGATTSTANLTCYDKAGYLVKFAANTPRQSCWDWTHAATDAVAIGITTQTPTNIGFRREGPVNQLVTNMEDFSQSSWTKTGVTLASRTQPAPDETTHGSVIKEDASTGTHQMSETFTKAATALSYVANCHFQPSAGSRNVFVSVGDGAGNGVTVFGQFVPDPNTGITTFSTTGPPVPFGTGITSSGYWADQAGSSGGVTPWGRLSLQVNMSTATTLKFSAGLANGSSTSYTGDGASSANIFGCNLVQQTIGSVQLATAPHNYMPFTGAKVNDQIIMNMPIGMQGSSSYGEFLRVVVPRVPNGLQATFTSLTSADEAQRITLLQTQPASSGVFGLQVLSDTINFPLNLGGPYNTAAQETAIAANAAPGAQYIETIAQTVKRSVNVAFPSVPMTKMRIGGVTPGSTLSSNISIPKIVFYQAKQPEAILHKALLPTGAFNPDTIRPTPDGKASYFTQAMISQVKPTGIGVWTSARCPASDAEDNSTYIWYPATVCYNQQLQLSSLTTGTHVAFAWEYWQNRCDLCSSFSLVNKVLQATIWVNSTGQQFVRTVSKRPIGQGTSAWSNIVGWFDLSGNQVTDPGTGLKPSGIAATSATGSATYYAVASSSEYAPGDRLIRFAIDPVAFWVNADTGLVLSAPPPSADIVLSTDSPPNTKPNSYSAPTIKIGTLAGETSYSTFAKSSAATIAILEAGFGYPANGTPGPGMAYGGWKAAADAAGLRVFTWDQATPGTPTLTTAATYTAGTPEKVTLTTVVPHAIVVGQQFTLAGFTPTAYNGTYTATTGTTGSTVVGNPAVAFGSNPGTVTVFGKAQTGPITLTALAYSTGQITATTSTPHGLLVGGNFVISGSVTNADPITDPRGATIYNTLYKALPGTTGSSIVAVPVKAFYETPATLTSFGSSIPTIFDTVSPVVGGAITIADAIITPPVTIQSGTEAVWGGMCDCERTDGTLASVNEWETKQHAAIIHYARNAANTGPAGYKMSKAVDDYLGAGQNSGDCGYGATAANCDTTNLGRSTHQSDPNLSVDLLFMGNGAPPPKGFTFDSAQSARLAMLGTCIQEGGTDCDETHVMYQANLGPPWPGGPKMANARSSRAFIDAHAFGAMAFAPVNLAMGGDECRWTNEKKALIMGTATDDSLVADGCTVWAP